MMSLKQKLNQVISKKLIAGSALDFNMPFKTQGISNRVACSSRIYQKPVMKLEFMVELMIWMIMQASKGAGVWTRLACKQFFSVCDTVYFFSISRSPDLICC